MPILAQEILQTVEQTVMVAPSRLRVDDWMIEVRIVRGAKVVEVSQMYNRTQQIHSLPRCEISEQLSEVTSASF